MFRRRRGFEIDGDDQYRLDRGDADHDQRRRLHGNVDGERRAVRRTPRDQRRLHRGRRRDHRCGDDDRRGDHHELRRHHDLRVDERRDQRGRECHPAAKRSPGGDGRQLHDDRRRDAAGHDQRGRKPLCPGRHDDGATQPRETISGGEGQFGVAVAVDVINSQSNAYLDGNATVHGAVNVTAKETTNIDTGFEED